MPRFTEYDIADNLIGATVPIVQEGENKQAPSSLFGSVDVIIKTQAEFKALIASSTWFDAVSVALVGQFTLNTANNGGVKIPATVKQIHGYNGAKITITNFVYDSTTAKGGLWYDEKPEGVDCEIRNLEVDCTGGSGDFNVYGFSNCTNLTNCIGTGNGDFNVYGFSNCTNLTNCIGTGNGGYVVYGFDNCTNLTNCIGTGTGDDSAYGEGYGFNDCTNLTNCIGTGNGENFGFGFINCTNLTNCIGTGNGGYAGYGFDNCTNLTNCIGTGVGDSAYGEGYGFSNCSYANGCRAGDTPSTTSIWGGTNLKIDEDSCEMMDV